MIIDSLYTIDAIAIGSTTLVGFWGDFPRERGNCIQLIGSDYKYYKILNFNHENLQVALVRKLISWPIKIHILRDYFAVIHDERIPHAWYKTKFCLTCCPYDLLPLSQKLAYQRDILSKVRELHGDCETYHCNKTPQWPEIKYEDLSEEEADQI